jgi:RimJ/RimL family protein N-acetyltransferase
MQDPGFTALRSERLVIRRFATADAEAFNAYRSDPEVARYQGWDSCSLDEAQQFIRSLEGLAPGSAGRWFQFAVALIESQQLVGDCALRCTHADPRQAELGFTFARAHHGQGFAIEAVRCVLRYAFTTLDVHRIFAITDVRNLPAQRLLERLEFRREGHFIENTWFKGSWSSELLYAQLRAEWQRRSGTT